MLSSISNRRVFAFLIDLYWIMLLTIIVEKVFIGRFSSIEVEIFIHFSCLFFAFLVLIFKDYFSLSIGKRILKLHIYNSTNNQIVDKNKIVLRNALNFIFFPLNIIMLFIVGQTLTDIITKTYVSTSSNKNFENKKNNFYILKIVASIIIFIIISCGFIYAYLLMIRHNDMIFISKIQDSKIINEQIGEIISVEHTFCTYFTCSMDDNHLIYKVTNDSGDSGLLKIYFTFQTKEIIGFKYKNQYFSID